ncbi:hypothetical protein RhiirA5_505907 [Rhizophagus irregularis]|uniref:Uncharacterized protein n=1 Tax=Rhizophagus irregularis TaxID=588596 RepID=A0A2N0NWU1_9GLOM|nr:hypothetical protein RhiirA5_505907 [Rhizophagus irregularis]
MARTFSEDLKWRIIYLHHDGYSRIKIGILLHISKRTVDNILQIYVQWRTVVNPWQKPPGRHKILIQNEMKILRELVKDKVDWYLDELVGELEQQTGKLVSIPTLWRSLVYCGISRKKLHQAVYEQNELLRSTFIAKVGRDYKPEQLIFMDEAFKDERTLSRRYGYSLKNTFAIKKNAFSLQNIIAVPQMNSYPGEQSVLVLDNA